MSTPTTVKNALQAAITKANAVTGEGDTTVTDAVNSLIAGYGQGGGITPSGSLTITENGTFDVTTFASVTANITGLNARVYNVTRAADSTAYTAFIKNDWLKSIRSNPNAFAIVRYLGASATVAAVNIAITANFPFYYNGSTVYYSFVGRCTGSSGNTNASNKNLNVGSNYNGHININSSGELGCYGNATYPIKAGNYQIIAGIAEGL